MFVASKHLVPKPAKKELKGTHIFLGLRLRCVFRQISTIAVQLTCSPCFWMISHNRPVSQVIRICPNGEFLIALIIALVMDYSQGTIGFNTKMVQILDDLRVPPWVGNLQIATFSSPGLAGSISFFSPPVSVQVQGVWRSDPQILSDPRSLGGDVENREIAMAWYSSSPQGPCFHGGGILDIWVARLPVDSATLG